MAGKLSYAETLAEIERLQTALNSGAGNRLAKSQELMRLKRLLPKFPEHKALKAVKSDNADEQSC
jgi:hypothetical protein